MLDLVGNDHQGIIRDLAHVLAQRVINIDELQTACTSAPMTGGTLFKTTARLRVPRAVAVGGLRTALERLAYDLMVAITLAEIRESLSRADSQLGPPGPLPSALY
jgi:glycine cleavage system regulatory protein